MNNPGESRCANKPLRDNLGTRSSPLYGAGETLAPGLFATSLARESCDPATPGERLDKKIFLFLFVPTAGLPGSL